MVSTMKLEYKFLEDAVHNREIDLIITELNRYNISKVSVLSQYSKIFKKKLAENIKLSSIIDFPYGASDASTRIQMLENSIKIGVDSVELILPFHLLSNSMFTAIKKDVELCFTICKKNKIDISYVLEYRTFNYSVLYRVCKLLLKQNINHIYISTGYKIDDIYDHLIAMTMIQKNVPEINITCNANIFTEKHISILNNSDINTFSVNSIPSLEMAHKFVSNL